MPKRNIWQSFWQLRRWKLRRFLFLHVERARERERNTLRRQNKNDILMTSLFLSFHTSRMLLGAMFVSSTWSKQRTYIKVVKHIYTHSILEAGLLVSLRSYFEPLVKHSTPTQNTQEREAGSVPAPSSRHSSVLYTRCCCHLNHIRDDSTYFTLAQLYKSSCIHS